MTSVRLVVDPVRCDGHGICMLFFGERVDLDEWGYAVVDPEPFADPQLVRRARRAVAACPENALLLDPGA
ncbi:MAG: ferredoxin [Acidimicrobiales bacterium]